MSKINLAIDRAVLDKNIQKARENNVIIPTLLLQRKQSPQSQSLQTPSPILWYIPWRETMITTFI